jgi:hypothetical protein
MMVWSINLLVLAIGFLIVGMIKPHWILFWMEKPKRIAIIILSVVLFMAAAVMFGEANKEKQQKNSTQAEEPTPNKVDMTPTAETVKKEQSQIKIDMAPTVDAVKKEEAK